MKPLTKYLNPKSQWHKPVEFPKEPNFYNIIEFLEDSGFVLCEDAKKVKWNSYIPLLKYAQQGYDTYTYGFSFRDPVIYWIRFCTKISKDQTQYIVYFIRVPENNTIDVAEYYEDVACVEFYTPEYNRFKEQEFSDYDEFIKQLKIDLNW